MSGWDNQTKDLFALAMSIFVGATLFLGIYRFGAFLCKDLPLSFLAAIFSSVIVILVTKKWISSNLAR